MEIFSKSLKGYNEITKATALSNKAQKADRKTFREGANSKNGQRAFIKEKGDAKLLELQERENRLKAENPKYKKKFKYQLEAEIQERNEKEIKERNEKAQKERMELVKDYNEFGGVKPGNPQEKQEPRLLYFDRYTGEPVYNLAGKEQERTHREFLRKNRETCEKQRQEKERQEARERAEYWKKEIEKRKKEAIKTKQKATIKEAEAKIETLENGSYMGDGQDGKNMSYALGYMVEIDNYRQKRMKKEHVGVGKDEKDGKTYIGISIKVNDKAKALEIARNAKHNYETGEKAIWDCKNQCEIRL